MPLKNIFYKFIIIIFCISIVIFIITCALFWRDLLAFAQLLQRAFHEQLTFYLNEVKSNTLQVGYLLIGLSLVYGIVHAAGPGHGKFIITTYLSTQPSQLASSLYITLFSAIMQAVVAIILVTLLLIIFNFSSRELISSEYWLEYSSYLIVIIMGFMICYHASKKMIKTLIHMKKERKTLKIHACRAMRHTQTSILQPRRQHNFFVHTDCDCGHQHIPSPFSLNKQKTWFSYFPVIISIGIRPCSGAILVLLFSHVIGVYLWGIIATLFMAIGTAITTSFFAFLVYAARKQAEKLATKKIGKSIYHFKLFGNCLSFTGGVLFIIFGLVLITGLNISTAVSPNPLFR